MNKSLVPEYVSPQVNFQTFQIFLTNLVAIIPNIYFFYRSMTYKPFNDRKVFKYITMVLAIELIIACLVHIVYSGYLCIHHHINSKVHLITCSKLNILDLNINQVTIVTPFYFNIFRFYKVIFNKNPNPIVMIITFIITMGPLLYTMIGQYFQINMYYVVKFGCGYQIYSDIPYF
uniref:Serpentine receptor class gamma n=1 Tax=Strongyloides venezuelensis TaxID=75913 RepID=A0A0K0FIR6_STRVS